MPALHRVREANSGAGSFPEFGNAGALPSKEVVRKAGGKRSTVSGNRQYGTCPQCYSVAGGALPSRKVVSNAGGKRDACPASCSRSELW